MRCLLPGPNPRGITDVHVSSTVPFWWWVCGSPRVGRATIALRGAGGAGYCGCALSRHHKCNRLCSLEPVSGCGIIYGCLCKVLSCFSSELWCWMRLRLSNRPHACRTALTLKCTAFRAAYGCYCKDGSVHGHMGGCHVQPARNQS